MAKVRLQKLLSERGVASRRKAEELIAAGKVKVNGHPASLGDSADDRKDIVTVSGKRIPAAEEPTYLMLHKPRGYVTTLNDELGRKCVAELTADAGVRLFPVGRLDRESEGLLLMTNDGDFANAVIHPRSHIPKRYRVTVRGEVDDAVWLPVREGMTLDDGVKTLPATVETETVLPERSVVSVTLYEGRNREIRRMCEQLGLEVMRLKRVAIGTVKLGMLPVGKWRKLTPKEVRALVQASGATEKIAAAYIRGGNGRY